MRTHWVCVTLLFVSCSLANSGRLSERTKLEKNQRTKLSQRPPLAALLLPFVYVVKLASGQISSSSMCKRRQYLSLGEKNFEERKCNCDDLRQRTDVRLLICWLVAVGRETATQPGSAAHSFLRLTALLASQLDE